MIEELLTNPLIIAAFYSFAGLMHFVKPAVYVKAIPPYFPYRKQLNVVVGIAEIAIGVMLYFHSTRSLGAWGAIALLLAVFPAHIHTYQVGFMGIPRWIMAIRMFLQLLLIYWACLFI
jgi:uncharacterized membrane protein